MSGNLFLSIDFGNSPSTDTGTRPYTGSTPIWENASIWLAGGPNQTQTQVNDPTTVQVRVSNDGNAPITNVLVDAYVMNPNVGASSPSQALHQLSGFLTSVAPGSGGTSPTDAHVATCKIQDPIMGAIPWTPTPADLINTSPPGHLCLIANVYNQDHTDGGPLPAAATFNIANDPHQGQRNIALLAAAPSPHISPHLGFIAIPDPRRRETTVTLEPVRQLAKDPVGAVAALGASERWLLRSQRGISYERPTDDGPPRLVVARRGDEEPVPIRFSEHELKAVLTVGDEPSGRQARLGGQPVERPPFGVPASVRIDLSDESLGAMHLFDIVQRDPEGQPIGGGLRVLTVAIR
jgi:hypothetical protein